MQSSTEYFLWVSAEHFTNIISLNLQGKIELHIIPVSLLRIQKPVKLNNLHKVTQQTGDSLDSSPGLPDS